MHRSFSSSFAEYQQDNRSSESTSRFLPIRLTKTNCYSSDTDSHHQTYLPRDLSISSFCSSNSTNTANYRILPVRYSSVDRTLQKPVTISSNKNGTNVRIRFERPSSHHYYHHHHQREHKEEYEHYCKRHMTKEEKHYESCPVLNKNIQYSNNQQHPSNIKYIETRSIVRGYSYEQLNKPIHSSTLIIREQSLPPSSSPRVALTRIKHVPLDIRTMFKPIITRVIREEEE
jgi:hypothetical protein